MNKKAFLFAFISAFWSVSVQAADDIKSFAQLSAQVLPMVVNISAERLDLNTEESKQSITAANPTLREYFFESEGNKTSLGSGFIIDPKGYIVTNYHVIKDSQNVNVTLENNKDYKAQVIGWDEPTDLAVIKIENESALPYAELGDSDELQVGDWVLAVGNPFGLGSSISAGIVSAKSRDIDMGVYDNFIQTDAAINQGSSGGPLFDVQGKVVGINTALLSSSGESVGVGFAVPVNLSKFVIAELMQKGKVERGWIGAKIIPNEQDIAISDLQTFSGGVVVSEITIPSPAEKNLEAGDIIMAIDGRDVKDIKDFSRRIAESKIDQEIILRVWRSQQPKDISLKVALRPTEQVLNPQEYNDMVMIPDNYIKEIGISLKSDDQAVTIDEVATDSQAYEQGIKSGDIINQINQRSVNSIADVKSYVGYAISGSGELHFNITRDGIEHNITLMVGNNEQN